MGGRRSQPRSAHSGRGAALAASTRDEEAGGRVRNKAGETEEEDEAELS